MRPTAGRGGRLARVAAAALGLGALAFAAACSSVQAAAPPSPAVTETALSQALVTPVPDEAPATPTPPAPTAEAAPPTSKAAAERSATLDANLPTGTPTPTAEHREQPTLGAFSITPLAGATLVTPNPTAVEPLDVGSSVVNILLIGTDYREIDPTFRTDTLIVASINKEAGAVTLLSIPRDLFVYVPRYGMARINLAYNAAESIGYPGGGPALLEQTILYNLGIPIHYYAKVNFDGFRKIVDTLGGVDVPVNCQLTEYKLLDPTLDERVAASYELYTQPAGVAHMDGALALWFARARPVGGDFFRGYRQRQVLRAIYHKAKSADVIPHVPELYAQFHDVVESDLGLWEIMQFVPMSARVDDTSIRSLHIGPNQTTSWVTPGGEAVLIPRPDQMRVLVNDFLSVEVENRLERELTWVEIVSGAGSDDSLALAAETLRNEGFAVRFGEPAESLHAETTLIDYTTSAKGSPLARLASILHVAEQNVSAQPAAASQVQFRVILGADYNSCPRLDWMDNSDATPEP